MYLSTFMFICMLCMHGHILSFLVHVLVIRFNSLICKFLHVQLQRNNDSNAGIYIHACIHTYIHTCMHACIHTYIRTYIHTYTHTHTYVRTYVHTYMHTYIIIKVLIEWNKPNILYCRIKGHYHMAQNGGKEMIILSYISAICGKI